MNVPLPAAVATADDLRDALADMDPGTDAASALRQLVDQGLDQLPLPGSGHTLDRWRALSVIAQHDLSLAKLYEGHTDALAILAELDASDRSPEGAIWGVWAAEAPEGRTGIASDGNGRLLVNGRKCWCSGATHVSHALVTGWHPDGQAPQLIGLALDQPGIVVHADEWHGVGMAGSPPVDVVFENARARRIGEVGDYLARPGFWHGGGGVAACWYGGASTLATTLHRSVVATARSARDPFRLAAIGKVDLALHAAAWQLREAAEWIDRHPLAGASKVVLRARLAAEEAARQVLDQAGRALGARPFCRDDRFARAAADLPVFVRQSHAERDLMALGERVLAAGSHPWSL